MADLHPDFLRLPIAHRGLHGPGVPENSMAAFRAAIAAGYGIECDIQRVGDGSAVVFHDDDLPRLTGQDGLMRDVSAQALGGLRLLNTAEHVPSLTELLVEVAGRVPLLIEIKDQDGCMGPDVGDLQMQVAAAVRGYQGPLAVMSFNPHAMAAFHRAAPDVAVGLTTYAYDDPEAEHISPDYRASLAQIADFDRVGASFISHDRKSLENHAVLALKQRGVPILCWTIRSAQQEQVARQIADNITFEGYLPSIP